MPLLPSKSTALSDLVLGATCVWALYALQGGTSTGLTGIKKCGSENYLAKLWFGMVSKNQNKGTVSDVVMQMDSLLRFSYRPLLVPSALVSIPVKYCLKRVGYD